MSEIKLVLTDMDGTTVLPGKHEISERVRESIIAVEDAGITVAAVTGRPYEMAKDALLALGIEGPCVFDNGASVRDSVSGNILWRKWLTVEELKNISSCILEYCTIIDYSGEYKEHVPEVNELDYIVNPAPFVFGLVHKESKQVIEERLAGILDITAHFAPSVNGEEHLLGVQVNHVNADKFHGVEALRSILNITKEHSLAIGDGDNDLPLFRNAGLRVAMGNATDRLKQQADEIVSTVENDGFAEAMERFVLGAGAPTLVQ